jgi:hypothetical protein
MPCIPFRTPSGAVGLACTGRTRRQRCACGAPATLLCDWKTPARTSGTCDAPICASCATSPAPGKDLCPAHAQAWKAWREAR